MGAFRLRVVRAEQSPQIARYVGTSDSTNIEHIMRGYIKGISYYSPCWSIICDDYLNSLEPVLTGLMIPASWSAANRLNSMRSCIAFVQSWRSHMNLIESTHAALSSHEADSDGEVLRLASDR